MQALIVEPYAVLNSWSENKNKYCQQMYWKTRIIVCCKAMQESPCWIRLLNNSSVTMATFAKTRLKIWIPWACFTCTQDCFFFLWRSFHTFIPERRRTNSPKKGSVVWPNRKQQKIALKPLILHPKGYVFYLDRDTLSYVCSILYFLSTAFTTLLRIMD